MKVLMLACSFLVTLYDILGEEKMLEVARLNTGEHESICHTHDFVDANEVMMQAFEDVFARPMDFEGDLELTDRAWTLAKLMMLQDFDKGLAK